MSRFGYVRKRRDLKALCRFRTSREMYMYFKDCSLVKSHKLSGVIERLCPSLEFAGGPVESGGEVFQENSQST